MNHLRLVLLTSTAIATLSLSSQLAHAAPAEIIVAQQDLQKGSPSESQKENQGQPKQSPRVVPPAPPVASPSAPSLPKAAPPKEVPAPVVAPKSAPGEIPKGLPKEVPNPSAPVAPPVVAPKAPPAELPKALPREAPVTSKPAPVAPPATAPKATPNELPKALPKEPTTPPRVVPNELPKALPPAVTLPKPPSQQLQQRQEEPGQKAPGEAPRQGTTVPAAPTAPPVVTPDPQEKPHAQPAPPPQKQILREGSPGGVVQPPAQAPGGQLPGAPTPSPAVAPPPPIAPSGAAAPNGPISTSRSSGPPPGLPAGTPASPSTPPTTTTPLPAAPQSAATPIAAGTPPAGGGRMEDFRNQRQQSEEGGRTIIREPDRVIILDPNGQSFIRHNDADRFRYGARDVRVEQVGNESRTIIIRPDGTEIITVNDREGRLLRRIRRDDRGRELIIIDNSFRDSAAAGDFYVNLPPPVLRIPQDRYIVESETADATLIYDTLIAPPVDRIQRRYSLDEIRYSPSVRQRMPSIDLNTINFESGSWEIPQDQASKLQVIADGLNRAISRNPSEVFLVEGHTDAVGSDVDNLSLSDRRAESAATLLSQQFQVPAENLTSQGYGKQYLKIPTDGPERQNRRVTIRRITPLLTGQNQALPAPPAGTVPRR
jgi:outer membrane protein OmpA-like peptidoglycan-associated protein